MDEERTPYMTSNLRRTLQAALAVVAVVGSAAEARAQELETPGTPPPAAAPGSAATAVSTGFGDSGQWLLSVENLFGYTYAHQSNDLTVNTFTIFGDSLGTQKSMYNWPRLALDTMITKSISVGLTGSFARVSTAVPNTVNQARYQYAVAARAGYATLFGPWLGIWPRAGITYSYQSGNAAASAFAITLDGLLVFLVAPHLLVTFGPEADVGVTGKIGNTNVTYLNIGAYFGLTVPL
jgi:hypothetical protein